MPRGRTDPAECYSAVVEDLFPNERIRRESRLARHFSQGGRNFSRCRGSPVQPRLRVGNSRVTGIGLILLAMLAVGCEPEHKTAAEAVPQPGSTWPFGL